MMDSNLQSIETDVDLTQAAPLNRRRVVSFVNAFLLRMTDMLNQFANQSETALIEAERRLYDADVRLRILEAKLSGVSEESESGQLGDVAPSTTRETSGAETNTTDSQVKQNEETTAPNVVPSSPAPPAISSSNDVSSENHTTLLVQDDPLYTKYFKMLKLGVPEPAVKQKMSAEGLDPSILNTPDAPSPNMKTDVEKKVRDESSDWDSVSSFSDSD